MIKNLTILGSTGSIGTQSLEVARALKINISALAAYNNINLLEAQIREFRPKVVAVFDEAAAKELKANVADTSVTVLAGLDGVCEAAAFAPADLVLNSVVGMVGILPTLAAIDAKKNVALANKETLVAGGQIVMAAAKKNGVKILPVDSEHSAIFQCLQGCPEKSALKKIILTASGGPFFGKDKEFLKTATKQQALKHPNWSMGAKVTIDSASMMNKGLELIEAFWLFDVPESAIDIVVHKESIVHSLIEYRDNSVIAQLGTPDMKIPIQYALTYPKRYPCDVKPLDLTEIGNLSFFKPDYENFKCLRACKEAIERGGLAPAAANAANEEAVRLFLSEKISFLEIGDLVYEAMRRQPDEEILSLDDIMRADKMAREYVLTAAGK